MPENAGEKQANTRWVKGQSGNPRGKPKGTRNRVLQALDALGEEAAEEVLAAVLNAARLGDTRAAELLLKRVWPERRGRPVEFTMPEVKTPSDITSALAVVLAAVGDGQLSPAEGQGVVALLEAQGRAIEMTELEARIAALEAGR